MALRAPKPEPEEPDAIHAVLGHWKMGRWHRVLTPDGDRVAESSNPEDDFMQDAIARGGKLQRQRVFIPAEDDWIDQ